MPRPIVRKGKRFTTVSIDGEVFDAIKRTRMEYPDFKSDNDVFRAVFLERTNANLNKLYKVNKKEIRKEGW